MPKFKRVKIKICLLGDPAVGKTSLIQKYIYNFFGDTYMRTLGTKVSRKVVKFNEPENDIEYELTMMIWDIMGQKFSSMPLDKYLKLAQGALIVCDITRKDTFKSLADWKKTLFNETGQIPVVCLANKIDLEKNAAIKMSEFNSFCNSQKVGHFTTSAKTGKNVNDAFLTLGKLIMNFITKEDVGKELPKTTEPIPAEEEVAEISADTKPISPPVGTTPAKIKPVTTEELDIKPGLGYVIKEEKPNRSFQIFKQLVKNNIRGLCITRTHPDRIREEFQIQDIPILWLSADAQKDENIVVPTFLPQLNTLIIDFIQKYNDVVVLLEGIEYLIDQNDFKTVLSLIHSLNDYIMGSNARLIIPLDPLTLGERELHMLTRDFKIL
jgi:small GTP-binding protein